MGGNGISAERTERGRGCVGNATDGTRKARVGNATDGTRKGCVGNAKDGTHKGCVGNATDGTRKARVGNATDGTRLNHEIWATCPTCGYEYDRRVLGDTCPKCARRTMDIIRKGVMRNAES